MASSMHGPDGSTGRRGESASLHGEAPIGVAVIGCGSIANPHFAGWQRLEQAGRARLAAACDDDPSRAQAAAELPAVYRAHGWRATGLRSTSIVIDLSDKQRR